MSLEIEKDPDENVGGYLSFTYPKLPKDLDFEVFRKTDKDWKKLIHWYNNAQDAEGSKKSKKEYDFYMWKERFVLLQWPRDPKGPPMKLTPRGKDTGNGECISRHTGFVRRDKLFQAVSYGARHCMTSIGYIVFRIALIYLRYVSAYRSVIMVLLYISLRF